MRIWMHGCVDVGMYERRDVGMCECIKCTDAWMYKLMNVEAYECRDV